jgi:hypothetical protein
MPDSCGYVCVYVDGKNRRVHDLMVEAVMGGKPPDGTEAHHINGDKNDNRTDNLVICQDRGYHATLHMRERALNACGDPNFRPCLRCGEYGDPT